MTKPEQDALRVKDEGFPGVPAMVMPLTVTAGLLAAKALSFLHNVSFIEMNGDNSGFSGLFAIPGVLLAGKALAGLLFCFLRTWDSSKFA